MSDDRLKKELETYEARKPELLSAGEGKFALIQGDSVVGVWDTYEDALKAGYEKFGIQTPFLVKQISGMERVQFFTTDLITLSSARRQTDPRLARARGR